MNPSTPSLGLIGTSLLDRLGNLDLVAILITVAAVLTLGFVVYFNNPKSSTNRAFLMFSLMTVAYGSANFASYQITDPWQVLWLLRITMFSAVWHAVSFFYLFFVFPQQRVSLPRWFVGGALPIAAATSMLTLTPYVFESIQTVSEVGSVTNPIRGPAIPLFGAVAGIFVIAGLWELLKKTFSGADLQRKQARVILFGAATTFLLILICNVLLPLAFDILRFIPLVPIFFLPFILLTAHAIRKYRFLETKVLATEIFALVLVILNMIELVIARDLATLILRIGVFSAVLAFSIMLIQSVIREVKQREELRTLTDDLQKANGKLTELDQLKSQFLSFASHQLRSPLTAIKWQAQLLLDGSVGTLPNKALETARGIEESSDRMIELVNEFLNLRKLEEGKMEYTLEPTDIAELASSVVTALKQLAVHKGLNLTYVNTATKTLCSVDRQKMMQVVQNLVDNAVKYTDHGEVRVAVEDASTGRLRILVSDTGHGIDPALIDKLFEQFVRDKKDAMQIEGTGLGLYIAKQMVDAHHGAIRVTSPGKGKGSTFVVELPTL